MAGFLTTSISYLKYENFPPNRKIFVTKEFPELPNFSKPNSVIQKFV